MADVIFESARSMAAMVASGEISAVELLQLHLQQVDQVNPYVNAIVSLDPELAFSDARAADEAYTQGRRLGPLHGLPMAFKDTHSVTGLPTTHGWRPFAHQMPSRDDLVIARLRQAGVVRMGKTNVPEFAAGSHTFNRLFGTTRNPFDLTKSAGGSSGGAAASLACGMQPLADGSDMGGSLRNPASFCNVVGLRPSPGRVPVWPSELPWQTLAVQGPMARSVDDLAYMLDVISGPEVEVPLAWDEPDASFGNAMPMDLSTVRVGWSPDLGGSVPVDADVIAVLERRLSTLESLGCRIVEVQPDFAGADEVFRTLRAWQFQSTFGALLDAHPGALKASLEQNILDGRRLSGQAVSDAFKEQARLYQRFSRYWSEIDVLVLPVSQVAPFDADLEFPILIDGRTQAMYLDWMRSCYLVSALSLPALSIPAGFTDDGLPVGLQVVGPFRDEARVLAFGRALEVALPLPVVRPEIADRHDRAEWLESTQNRADVRK